MIHCKENCLQITIPTTSPLEYRDSIIRAIADNMRCRAHVSQSDRRIDDGEHQIIMSEVLDALIDIED